jgi:hypothetical protein
MDAWYAIDSGGVTLELLVRPQGRRARCGAVQAGRLKVAVKAPAEKGKANAAVIKLLAKLLGVSRADVRIVRGRTGRRKTVRVKGTVDVARLRALEKGERS